MVLQRRAFLRIGGGILASTVAASLTTKAVAQVAAPALIGVKENNCRTLTLEFLNTGERLKADYWVDGQYIHDELARIDKVLRDFRTGEVHPIEPKLLDLIHHLGRDLETESEFQIICGYRSPRTNAMLHDRSSGVAEKSLHMKGQAIDLRVPGRPLKHVHEAALKRGAGGVGYYAKSNFVHVDTGRVRRWTG
jgi:uncharacterized protein YcbK (DUF882 family)